MKIYDCKLKIDNGEMGVRTGIGYDVHRLEEGETLVIGGVTIPFEKGAVGHSDGDALSHAVVDALLGAANLGDLGLYFPSDDDQWKDASSLEFLKYAAEKVRSTHLAISNVDATVVLEEPKLSPHINEMKSNIAAALGIDMPLISVKATTTDGVGFIGRGEGIGAMAVATLTQE